MARGRRKLTREERDYVEHMAAWLKDSSITIKQHDDVIADHQREITSHKASIQAQRTMRRLDVVRYRRAIKAYNAWRKKRGLHICGQTGKQRWG